MPGSLGAESSPDQDTRLADFLEPVSVELATAVRFMRREEKGPYTSRLSKQVYPFSFRWEKDVDQTGDRLIASAARLLLQSDRTDSEAEVEELIDACFRDVSGEDFSLLSLAMLSSAEVVTHLQGFVRNVITPAAQAMQTPRQRYDYMQLLAQDVPYDDPSKARVPDTLSEIAFTLQALQAFSEAEGLAQVSWQEAETQRGDFDSLIAEDMLEQADARELSSSSVNTRDAELVKMVKLAMYLSSKPKSTVIAELSRRDILELWPETLKAAIEHRKTNYLQALQSNRSNRMDFLSSCHCILPKAVSEEAVLICAQDFGREVARQQSTDTHLSARQRVAARVRLESYGPRRKPTRQARRLGNRVIQEADPAQAEEDPPERQITYIDSNGNEAAEGSDNYRRFLNEYLNQFKGEPGLEEALDTMIAYLKATDWASALPNGVKKLKGFSSTDLLRGERRFSKVYEFKPQDAAGMPVNSERARNIRIVFVRQDNTIGLVGIANRGNMDALERKLGMKRAR